ncbi:GNAT family N-acetyltransferase [Robiginitalea sp. M366]|uniref:GNAT family N-acetyltransferase n=1 Tax=Robiginitalea aestuariiviva TaxID=3036903 RepID=UPI00240D3BA0|nr:GNAT family N-acetyltransferase [Robiginitalea aestuariiviva]MDG1573160.1 GNAT family N-acetyltransferase [Robiginitalea aestuariiviva]
MRIAQATLQDLDLLVPLLDGYRVFYKQPSDKRAGRSFLRARLQAGDSTIFLAQDGNAAIGFTQLYPSFSTVSLCPVYILNDLFVLPGARGKGVGAALLTYAQQWCRQRGGKGLALETAVDNPARQLYERLGWQKDTHCFHYFWIANP